MVCATDAPMVTTFTGENATDLLVDITPTVTDNIDSQPVKMEKNWLVTPKQRQAHVINVPQVRPEKEATSPPVALPALLALTHPTTSIAMLVVLKMESVANAIAENDSVPSHLLHN